MKKIIAKTLVQPELHACDCLVLFHSKSIVLKNTLKTVNQQLGGALSSAIKSKEFNHELGSHLMLNTPQQSYKRLLLIGLGKDKHIQQGQWLQALLKLATQLKNPALKKVLISTQGVHIENSQIQPLLLASTSLAKANYQYSTTLVKKKPSTQTPLEHILELIFCAADSKEQKHMQQQLDMGLAIAQGINVARELGNLPANYCTPKFLAAEAQRLAKNDATLHCQVLGEKEMRKLKMNALLSVSAGSDEEAKLIQLEYKGGKAHQKPIVLIGKGITFDTGGISLKPGVGMDEMKFDMCGAASVIGVIHALKQSRLPLNVTGIIAASENMPSGTATKPGDVITSMSGQSIEILNTDAEGRLVLCDALSYAQKYCKPALIIDIATLTGACVIALGSHASGLYSNCDELATALIKAGELSHDRNWRMPLWEDYNKQLKSNFADLANIGGREAGSITAACFLSHFIENHLPWAHLDIAGVAWKGGDAKGATGRPVAMLMQFLLQRLS